MNIIAKRLRIIYKTGRVFEYTHVIAIATLGSALIVSGEKERSGGDITNTTDTHVIKKLLTMDVDWYVPLPEIKK